MEARSMDRPADLPAPPHGTVERWCWDFIGARALAAKLAPGESPALDDPRSWEPAAPPRCLSRPARPAELVTVRRSPRASGGGALERPAARARLFHTLMHHELQAAELFAWAVLAFPRAPRPFRAGLVRLAQEELAHLALYRQHLERLGFAAGAFPVRDWFWERVPSARDPAAFVALQGLGLEGANLEHSARLAGRLRAAGDAQGAQILERVGREEIAHVAFAVRWFERFTGGALDYDRWRAALPEPLTPALLRGAVLNQAARKRAGQSAAFLERLALEPPTTARSPR